MGRSVVTFGSIPKSNFWRVFDVFLDLVILPYFNAISMDFYAVKFLINIILCNFHVCKWKNAYIIDLNALWILMNFLCIYLGEKGGGVALMHVYVWEHIVSLYYSTAWWMFTKLGRDEVLMVPYKCCCFSARSPQGQIQGGAKIGHTGSPSSTNFFFRLEGYSNKPNS